MKTSSVSTRSTNECPTDIPKQTMLLLYESMLKIRMAEEKIVDLYPQQEMRCPTHLSIGQEAAAAGVCAALKPDDLVLSTHRCHGHYLAKGGGLEGFFAELYGKVTGCSKGKGGSMHLVAVEHGFLGASAIVGGTIPMGVGLAWGLKLEGTDRVAAAFFGDGATEEGVFHESLNFAALKKLPILFVCENNFYATQSPLSARQPLDNIERQGEVHGVRGERLDGTDVVAVYRAAQKAVVECRQGRGPVLLEIRAYRWKEHVGPNYDHSWGYRTKKELDEWMEKCPLKIYEERLLLEGAATRGQLEELKQSIKQKIDAAICLAKEAPFPSAGELYKDVTGGNE